MADLDSTGIEEFESDPSGDALPRWRFDPFTPVANQRKPHVSLPNDESVVQDKEDLEAQQAFSQWWSEGAQMGYSNALAYQGDTQGLEQFNQVLVALYISVNSKARAALFRALQTVMDYRSGFTVNLTSLADAIPLLAAKFHDDDYDNYLACFTAFFSQTWLNSRNASEQTPDDIKKISLLFRVNMKIITTNTISTPEKLSQLNQFVFDLNTIIKDTYWSDWHTSPLSHGIQNIFAKTPAVASLLAQNTTQEQLGRYLQLIKANPDNISDQKLHQYFAQEIPALSDNPSIIPYLFELAIAGITMPSLIDALPTVLCIPDASTESHEHLWSFLSKRTPIHQLDSQKLLTILNSDRFDTADRQRIMAVLNTLPPYVSLKYINKQLSSPKSWETSLSEVDESGRALCLFLRARGLVTSIDHFTRPNDQVIENWNHFLSCFDQTMPERNVSFFKLINSDEFKDVELNQLNKLASYYSTDSTVTLDQIQQILRLGNKILNIPGTISSAIQRYYNSHLQADFHTLLDPNGKFSQFLDLLIEKKIALPESMFLTLYVPWKENRIDRFVLTKALEVSKTAVALQKDRNWQAYFSSMDKNKIARQDMMQHLTCGLLNLGQDFDRVCHANYTLFARRVIASNPSQNKSHPFKFLMQLITEIKTIATHLYQITTPPITTHGRFDNSTHSNLALQKLSKYRGCFMFWGTTLDRKVAAVALSENIKSIDDYNPSKEDYYPKLLNTILATQEKILNDDNKCGYKRNRSGSSRLYNITSELFVKGLQDFILEEDVSIASKAEVYDICRRQLKSHLSMLQERLYGTQETNQLRQMIRDINTKIPTDPSQLWAPQDVTISALKNYLDNNPKCIPKHLRYLLSPINLLCEMSAAPSEYASSTL